MNQRCNNCFESVPLADFPLHKGKLSGRRGTCKLCHNYMQHQRKLVKKLNEGSKAIRECSKCEALMKRNMRSTSCHRCDKIGRYAPGGKHAHRSIIVNHGINII